MKNSFPIGFLTVLSLLVMSRLALAETGNAIAWTEWSETPFALAERENKMVLIDVGIEGCTACRWMDESTYGNARVIALVQQHFVTIQVDADARPDIGERYSDWAWPATIFLAPDGAQVLAIRGNRQPRNFIPILNELIEKHANGELDPDELAPYAAPPGPQTTELTQIRDRVRGQLDRSFDQELGGWGRGHKNLANATPLLQLFMRAHLYDDQSARDMALKTLVGMTRVIDPVWGGIYISSVEGWDSFIPEKRTGSQASALLTFAEGYQLTHDPRFLEAAAEVDRYLTLWMRTDEGTFFTSQEDDATGLGEDLDARQYYLLESDAERRQYGIPPIDHAVYTDLNGRVIEGYARLYEASGDRSYLEKASRAAKVLLDERQHEQGWMIQAAPTELVVQDKRMRPHDATNRPYLRPQGAFALGLLALYRATGDDSWLEAAARIAAGLRATLEDTEVGGFFGSSPLDVAPIPPRKPLEDNAASARFLYELWVYTKDDSLEGAAERTMRAVAHPDILRREGRIVGNLAVALETVTAGYVEFSVVGEPGDAHARALHASAREVYEPRKILHFEKPGRYPDRGRPAMYICNEDACSLPIVDPALVAKEAARFRGPVNSASPRNASAQRL